MPLDELHRSRIRNRPARLAARFRIEQARERVEQPVDPGIVEPARYRREDRDLGIRPLHGRVISPPLLAHVAQRILRAPLLELVESDQLGEIEHVDLLELARGTILAGHHVHRHVDEVDDLRVALADACRLHHDQIEPGALEQVDGVGQYRAGREVPPPGRQRTHEDLLVGERVHPDAVAEQRAAAPAAGRIHGDYGNVAAGV